MQSKGQRLIKELKNHIMDTMRNMDECKPNGKGAISSVIEDMAGLNIDLPKQNGWITWSILFLLNEEGIINLTLFKNRRYFKLNN